MTTFITQDSPQTIITESAPAPAALVTLGPSGPKGADGSAGAPGPAGPAGPQGPAGSPDAYSGGTASTNVTDFFDGGSA